MLARSYQYETSPRKYEPEYNDKPRRKKSKQNKQTKKSVNKKATRFENFKFRFMCILNAVMFLTAVFVISSRSALITQSFAEIQSLKTTINDIKKENDQLEINIQNSLNLSNIEQTAKDMLGMQKLTNKQTIYLSLPKKDYIEPSTEKVILEEKTNIIDLICNFIGNIF